MRLRATARKIANSVEESKGVVGMSDILVVDDQRVIRHLLFQVLSGMGHKVTLACNGLEALALCEAHRYDLIVLDHRMPGMDGLEVARHLSKSVRFILHTSDFGDRDITIAAMKLGAMGVVPKINNITAYGRELERFLEKCL